jgi:aromatase
MAGHTEQSVLINAPMQLVWDITNDVDNWVNLYTEYAETTVVERSGNTVRFRLAMHPDENGTVWSWMSERTMDPQRREVRAHRVENGPFDYMNIFWRYHEEAGGVRMTWIQDFHMKPTAPIDDEAMMARINKNSKIQMGVIKDKIEKAARDRRAGAA